MSSRSDTESLRWIAQLDGTRYYDGHEETS